MISPDKRKAALWAMNYVLVVARKMAYESQPHADIAAVLDGAEYLPMLMLEPRDQTEFFREHLVGMATKYPALHAAVERFDSGFDE